MVNSIMMALIFIAFSLGSFLTGYMLGRYRGIISLINGFQNIAKESLKNIKIEKEDTTDGKQ